MYSQSTLQPSALTIAHVSGQAPLQFKLYYLKRSTEQHMLLTASLFNGSERLFATQRAISIDTDTHPEILLYRTESRNDILPSLQPPRQYQGQIKNNNNFYQISLYLEEKGGALLLQNDQQHIGSWIEKDKNHSLEITCEGYSPITATRATNGPLLLKGLFSLPIELSLAKLSWPSGHIVMEGKIFKKKKQIIFEECNSQRELSLVLKNSQLAQINKLIQEKNTISVIIEGTFQENDFHPTYIFSVNDNPICLTASYASSPLLHTYWRLREVQGTVIQSFTDQPEPHLILNENGQASGSDGCNNFFMGWKQSGKNITFTPGGSTLRLCTQGEEQAQQILSIFSKIDSWNILGSILEFRGKENITAVFEAIDL
jgi:heat shock protein HslJ